MIEISERSESEISQSRDLKDHPLIGSLLVTVLVAIFLQMTWIVGVQNLAGSFTSDVILILSADFSFRMTMGAILLFLIIPINYGFRGRDAPLKEYREYLRLKIGSSITKTTMIGILSVLGFAGLMFLLANIAGVYTPDFSVLIVDYKWFVFILALVPGIWEELAFRGVVLRNLEKRFSPNKSVLIGAVLFGLFHFSNLVKDDLATVVFFVIMSTAFGIGWGYIVIKSNSVLPAILIHYSVDVLLTGPLFVDANLITDSSLLTFLVGLTLLFPIVCVVLVKLLYNSKHRDKI